MNTPFQPRLAHQLFYEGIELLGTDLMLQNPYYKSANYTWLDRVLHLLLDGDQTIAKNFVEYEEIKGKCLFRARKVMYALQFFSNNEWFVSNGIKCEHIEPLLNIDDIYQVRDPTNWDIYWWNKYCKIKQ